MISLNEIHEDAWDDEQELAAAAEDILRTRDRTSERRATMPVDHKYDRAPRGPRTNTLRRRRKKAPIRGMIHRRNKKVY